MLIKEEIGNIVFNMEVNKEIILLKILINY